MKFLLTSFIAFIALHLALAYFPPSFIPLGHFPYDDILKKNFYEPPFTQFANFDGYQYISIAKDGYNQLQQSYFPLYPSIIYYTSRIFYKDYILSGLIVSWLSLFLGIIYFKKLASLLLKDKTRALWSTLFLITFPTAFFYQAIYTDSLFLFLSSAALYYLLKRKILLPILFAFFASLTKIQGILLIIPFFLLTFDLTKFQIKKLSASAILLFFKKNYLYVILALSPFYGLIAYMIHLNDFYKDPLYFYHAQSAFGANRTSATLILLPQVLFRYLKIFLTFKFNFTYWVALFEFTTFTLLSLVLLYDLYLLIRKKSKDMPQIAVNLYSLAAITLPTFTGTLSSFPRYALISFGFFTALAKIKNKILKILILIIFSLFQLIFFSYFLKGYFVS